MKAIIQERYGPPEVLRLAEVETPTPGPGEVLVRIHAAALNALDWRLMRGTPFMLRLMGFGLLRPRNPTLGVDIAGEVAAVGDGVTRFKPGDAVCGAMPDSRSGAFAEFARTPEDLLVEKPSNIGFAEASTINIAACTALTGLRDHGQVQAGQKVLVVGASGGVGSFAVQIAKAMGAQVTGVCGTEKVDLVRGLGADHVVDYKTEDVTRNGQTYDLILDAGAYRPILDYRESLTAKGIYLLIGGNTFNFFAAGFLGLVLSRKDGRKYKSALHRPNQEDLKTIIDMMAAGTLKAAIGKTYPLEDTAQAIRDLEQGRAMGKLVIRVAPGG